MYTYEDESNKICRRNTYFNKIIFFKKDCLAEEDRIRELQYKSEEITQSVAQRDNKYGQQRREGKSYNVV